MAKLQGEPDLDPTDWDQFRAQAHQALDLMIDNIATVRDRPVWVETPADVKASFRTPAPKRGRDMADVVADVFQKIVPYSNGNRHPLFMGWVHGAGTPAGMVAEMLAAGLNSNCGGRNHVAHDIEHQVTRWMAKAFGFPDDASGLFLTGTSMANFLAVLVARTKVLGQDVRTSGLKDHAQLVAYASSEAHGCVKQAFELSGIGSANLRIIPVDQQGAMVIGALARQLAADRNAGLLPFMVAGTAGTVNTGAFDDLTAIADLAAAENLWFHVDGAFGALAALSPALASRVKGMERADSIAFDFHKWAHVPYDAGFLLVRDAKVHRETFASPVAYLSRAPRGLASGEDWPCDYGPDLSRGFRALKAWFTFQVHGMSQIGACMEHCCAIATYLANRIEGSARFEVRAPVALNIVCIGVKGSEDGALERELVMALHESGEAVPSLTVLEGRPTLRCAFVNHRTTFADVDHFLDQLEQCADRLTAQP